MAYVDEPPRAPQGLQPEPTTDQAPPRCGLSIASPARSPSPGYPAPGASSLACWKAWEHERTCAGEGSRADVGRVIGHRRGGITPWVAGPIPAASSPSLPLGTSDKTSGRPVWFAPQQRHLRCSAPPSRSQWVGPLLVQAVDLQDPLLRASLDDIRPIYFLMMQARIMKRPFAEDCMQPGRLQSFPDALQLIDRPTSNPVLTSAHRFCSFATVERSRDLTTGQKQGRAP